MKTLLFTLLIFGLSISSFAQEKTEPEYNPTRTWTSSDGKSTFKGKVTKYDGEKVSITPVGKNAVTSDIDKFSEEDKTWLEENKEYIGKSNAELKAIIESKKVCPVAKVMDGLTQINGDKAKLKKNAKYYLILFSASWCPPCRAEAPHIQKEYKDVIAANPDIELVLMSADRDKEAALKWAEKEQMTFPIYLDGAKYDSIPGVKGNRGGGIPHMVIVDREGKLIHHDHPGGLINKKSSYKEYCK